MHANSVRLIVMIIPVLLTAAAFAAGWPDVSAAPTSRTVYVTVTDRQGAPVTDLTPADFVVKEGGKEREIVKAEPAKTKGSSRWASCQAGTAVSERRTAV